MTLLEIWVRTPGVEALGWTLLHFVWEGAAIALALGAALGIPSSSRARYAVAGAALAAMLASFGLTFLALIPLEVETGIARRAFPCIGAGQSRRIYRAARNWRLEPLRRAGALDSGRLDGGRRHILLTRAGRLDGSAAFAPDRRLPPGSGLAEVSR